MRKGRNLYRTLLLLLVLSPYILAFARGVIGATFAASVVSKVGSPRQFADALPQFGVPRVARFVALVAIVSAEAVACATAVMGGTALVAGLLLAGVLLITFSVAMIRLLVIGDRTTNCYCFGGGARAVSWIDVSRNLGLVSLVAIALTLARGAFPANTAQAGEPVLALPASYLVVAIAGVIFALVWVHVQELAELFRPVG